MLKRMLMVLFSAACDKKTASLNCYGEAVCTSGCAPASAAQCQRPGR